MATGDQNRVKILKSCFLALNDQKTATAVFNKGEVYTVTRDQAEKLVASGNAERITAAEARELAKGEEAQA